MESVKWLYEFAIGITLVWCFTTGTVIGLMISSTVDCYRLLRRPGYRGGLSRLRAFFLTWTEFPENSALAFISGLYVLVSGWFVIPIMVSMIRDYLGG